MSNLMQPAYRSALERPSPDEFKELLGYIDPSDRDKWFMAFAIGGRVYNRDPSIFAILQAWSRGAGNHKQSDEKQERYEFDVSSQTSGAGIGTLIYWAKERGYNGKHLQHANVLEHSGVKTATGDLAKVFLLPNSIQAKNSDCARLWDIARSEACKVLSAWALYTKPEDTGFLRDFLASHHDDWPLVPEEARFFFQELEALVHTGSSYSLDQFHQWLKVRYDDTMNVRFTELVKDNAEIFNPQLCEEHFQKMLNASFCLALSKQAELLNNIANNGDMAKAKDALSLVYNSLQGVNQGLSRLNTPQTPECAQDSVMRLIDSNRCREEFLPSGYDELEDLIYGYKRGEVTILGAHSGVGKTWFGIDALYKAVLSGARVLFLSTEMSATAINLRLSCVVADMSMPKVGSGGSSENGVMQAAQMQQERFDLLQEFCDKHPDSYRIVSAKTGGLAIDQIEGEIISFGANQAVDLVVVDYLQNITNDGFGTKDTPAYQRLMDTMRRLTEMCRKYNCAALALAQLNNPNRKRTNVFIMLSGVMWINKCPFQIFMKSYHSILQF